MRSLTWRHASANRSCQMPPLRAGSRRPLDGVRVELGDHDDDRAAEVPPEGLRVLRDVGLAAGAAEEHVAQEVAAVLVLDRGHGLLAGDQQRRDGGGPLEGVHVGGVDRASG